MSDKRKTIELIDGVDLSVPFAHHNPLQDPSKIELPEHYLLLVRFPAPEEETRAGVVILPKEERDVEYPPNCSRVVGRGPGCEVPLGDYVFFPMRVPVEEEYYRKPQPLSFHYRDGDHPPVLWTFDERYRIANVPHGGDPQWFELKQDVEQLGASGKWSSGSVEWLGAGSIFVHPVDGHMYCVIAAEHPKDDDSRKGAPSKVFAFDMGPRSGGA